MLMVLTRAHFIPVNNEYIGLSEEDKKQGNFPQLVDTLFN